MPTYAQDTQVSADRSMTEIRKTVTRYGASQFAYLESEERAAVAFVIHGFQVRFVVRMPVRDDREFTHSPTGLRRAPATVTKAYEQAVKQRWRALLLVIKAKLEAVESGIVSFEEEFSMHMVLPDGRRAADVVIPAIEHAIATGGPVQLQIGAGQE